MGLAVVSGSADNQTLSIKSPLVGKGRKQSERRPGDLMLTITTYDDVDAAWELNICDIVCTLTLTNDFILFIKYVDTCFICLKYYTYILKHLFLSFSTLPEYYIN